MKSLILFTFLACLLLIVTKKPYENFSVVKLTFEKTTDLSLFLRFFPEDTLDILSNDGGVTPEMDIVLTPLQAAELSHHLYVNDLNVSKLVVLSRNLQEDIDREQKELKRIEKNLEKRLSGLPLKAQEAVKFSEDEFYTVYHNYEAISNYLENLRETHANMVEKDTIGETFEKRPITVYTVHAPGAFNSSKPALWVNTAQHAREWIAPPVGNYFFMKLLTTYRTDPEVKQILDAINVFYLPIVNIDGYLHTWAGNRMHRKNRRPPNGVDLNRNWRSGFGGGGSSSVPSSETYRGTHALSEPETKAISDFLIKHPQIKAGLDWHSYSQLNLRSWGKNRTATPDEERLLKPLGLKMVEAIKSTHGVTYQNIMSYQLYIASGTLTDEFYENHKMAGYTIELRPTQFGRGGFAPPPSEILPTCEENYKAGLVLANYVRTGRV